MKCAFLNCKKKIPLSVQWKCKCDGIFCSIHKDADMHYCTFDYKKSQKNKLIHENPQVIAAKIEMI
jgi:hypothetical protein